MLNKMCIEYTNNLDKKDMDSGAPNVTRVNGHTWNDPHTIRPHLTLLYFSNHMSFASTVAAHILILPS